MNNYISDKKMQRNEIRNRLQQSTLTYCYSSDQHIFQSIITLPEYQNASMIFCYVSVKKEVDTRRLLKQAWADGKRTAVPRCIDKGIMEPYEITSFNDLIPGLYNIPEPAKHCPLVNLADIDFAIVPCLSCDRKRRRLGHGGGYYDRTLAKLTAPSAALCREQLLLDEVNCEEHDRSKYVTLIKDLHAALFQPDLTVYTPYFVLIFADIFKYLDNIVMPAFLLSQHCYMTAFAFNSGNIAFVRISRCYFSAVRTMPALKTSEYVHTARFIFPCSFIYFHSYLHILIKDFL